MNLTSILNKINFNEITIKEDFFNLSVKLTSNTIIEIDEIFIKELQDTIPSRDSLNIFTITYNDTNSYDLLYDDIDTFIDDIQSVNEYLDEINKCSLNFTINKNKTSNFISIYCVNDFIETFNFIEITTLITILNSKFNNDYIVFEIIDDSIDYIYNSNCFIIKSIINENTKTYINDTSLIKNFKSLCFFSGKVDILFTPENFYFNSNIGLLDNIFKKLKIIFSLIYIFDYSSLDKNSLILKLNGYKNLESSVNLNIINLENTQVYYDIYKWIYTDGNINDKISIARNIISLYITDCQTLDLDNSILKAITSNYTLYIKGNVEKYIEIKSKVIENMLSTSKQLNDIISDLSNNYIKNLGVVSSFIISTVILNSISDNRLENIFTTDITIISISLLIISFGYFIYTMKEYSNQKQYIENLYVRLKESYSDLLLKSDIDDLVNEDKYLKEDLKIADKKTNYYKYLWIYSMIFYAIFIFIMNSI